MKTFAVPRLQLIGTAVASLLACALLTGCEPPAEPEKPSAGLKPSGEIKENVDQDEAAEAAKIKPFQDPAQAEIDAFQAKYREMLTERRWDELDSTASELRKSNEVFDGGSWRIVRFYDAFSVPNKASGAVWARRDQLFKDWIAEKPNSLTARIAYADFLVKYAWFARGIGYSNTVSDEGWRLMASRLQNAMDHLNHGYELPEKDPMLWMVTLTVALGQGWDKESYDKLMAEAYTVEPGFWGFYTSRAYSLLPRWHGEPGDWEAYADEAVTHPNGPGPSVYTRIVLSLDRFHNNIFRETKASWPKTRDGFDILLSEYPDNVLLRSQAALMASLAQDREYAQNQFDALGDDYIPSVWGKPERFVHCRNWARTGKW